MQALQADSINQDERPAIQRAREQLDKEREAFAAEKLVWGTKRAREQAYNTLIGP